MAGRIRLFDASGHIDRVLGRRGEGPGELRDPTAAIELADGRVVVVQRADPRLTIFHPASEPELLTLPGLYGDWLGVFDDSLLAAGIGSREERFAILGTDGELVSRFGARDASINEVPFWIYFARDHGAVLGDRVVVNTSFFATLRLFDRSGALIDSFGSAPDAWVEPTAPPVQSASTDSDRLAIEEWSRSFTVVTRLASAADELLVVQYGRFDPAETDRYRTLPQTIDVYDTAGSKLLEAAQLSFPVVGGGPDLLVLLTEPPDGWTIAAYRPRRAPR